MYLIVDNCILNYVNDVYINNLASSDIFNLVMYSSSNNKKIESIEILGNSEGLVKRLVSWNSKLH